MMKTEQGVKELFAEGFLRAMQKAGLSDKGAKNLLDQSDWKSIGESLKDQVSIVSRFKIDFPNRETPPAVFYIGFHRDGHVTCAMTEQSSAEKRLEEYALSEGAGKTIH